MYMYIYYLNQVYHIYSTSIEYWRRIEKKRCSAALPGPTFFKQSYYIWIYKSLLFSHTGCYAIYSQNC